MRIIDEASNKELTTISLFLTQEEAHELIGTLEDLVKRSDEPVHHHVSDSVYKHDIAVSVYTNENTGKFNRAIRD